MRLKNKRFLISRRANTVLAMILLIISVGVSIFLIVYKSAWEILWVTIPLMVFAVFFLRAKESIRKKVNVDHDEIRTAELVVWLVFLGVSGIVLFISALFGFEKPGELFIEAIRFLTGSE